MISTLDFESSDPSSNLGGTLLREDHFLYSKNTCKMLILAVKHRIERDWNGLKQIETDWNGLRQIETDWNGLKQIKIEWKGVLM